MEILDKVTQLDKLTANNEFVLVDFYTTQCGPCKKLAPILEDLSQEMTSIKFAKSNVEEADEFADKFDINAVPTIVLLKDGKEIARQEGLLAKTALKTWLNNLIK